MGSRAPGERGLGVNGRQRQARATGVGARPGVIQAWAEQLRERFGGAPVAVSVELSRGPVVSALLEHDFFRLFPVLGRPFAPSGAKDDPTDAEVILELLVRHRDKLKPLQPESADMRACGGWSSGVAT